MTEVVEDIRLTEFEEGDIRRHVASLADANLLTAVGETKGRVYHTSQHGKLAMERYKIT